MVDIETVKSCVEDLRNMLEDSLITEGKSFIKSFEDIRVSGDQAVIICSMPEVPENVSLGEGGVPFIVHGGGPLWTRTTDPSLIRTVL